MLRYLQTTLTLLLFLQIIPAEGISNIEPSEVDLPCDATKCNITINDPSLEYIRSRLKVEDPKFIKFRLRLDDQKHGTLDIGNSTSDVFEPKSWVWTYNSSRGMYPYLYWNVDFGLLSFGLLEAKTLKGRPILSMTVQQNPDREECSVTFGSRDTTKAIACAFEKLLTKNEMEKYPGSYFCFLAEKPGIRDSFIYTAAMYTLYPVDYINYNCCVVYYQYRINSTNNSCLDKQISKWHQCTILPYIVGIFLLLYFPILILRTGEALSENITVVSTEYELIGVENDHDDSDFLEENWVFLSEYSPYSIFDFLSQLWMGSDKSHPVLVSRVKRFILLILAPIPVFVQLFVYRYCWEPGLIQKFIKHGTPMGFLTLLGDASDRDKYFVPALGGGKTILLAYGILGLVIVVIPYNLKQIFQDGISKSTNTFNSPLCLGIWEIQDLSSIRVRSRPGYGYCADVCICSIYLICSLRFWIRALSMQLYRFNSFPWTVCSNKALFYLMAITIAPFYILFCIIELCLCLIWYGIPLCRLLHFLFRGVILSLLATQRNSDGRPTKVALVIRNPFVFGIIVIVLFAMSTFFMYTYCLIFIQSFQFLSQVLVFCFVAVIVYPAIAFGYLFFFVMLLYYMLHMIKGFGDGYTSLLCEAVEVSRNLDGEINYTTTIGSTLEVSNIKVHGINRIKIEGKSVCLPQNFFQSIANDTLHKPKIRMRHNAYGVPRKLFSCVIEKHRPTNQQFLKIVFQLVLITLLLAITMSITGGFVTGPTSEISDVMHVIFIVTIGALPRILEVAMSTSNESVKREIELRELEQTIIRYWQREEV